MCGAGALARLSQLLPTPRSLPRPRIISSSQFHEVIVRLHPITLAVLFLMLAPAFSLPSFSENPVQSPGQLPHLGANANDQDDHAEEQRAKIEKDMAKKANRERQAQLQRDTDSLVKLANELKEYVDKSNENTLSLDVLKKAEEIEKLAHSVKEKMKAN
jgi:hypothetical protein